MEPRYYTIIAECLEDHDEITAYDREKLFGIMEEELKSEKGDWLAYHFNGAAEYLAESEVEDELPANRIYELIGEAVREINILRKTGFGGPADFQQEMLDEAINRIF